jgi:murein DD-endopeptidase MepM/ murein hydrolase activator NlpD/3D (Asp-Asp-Asp) domain-containing protein
MGVKDKFSGQQYTSGWEITAYDPHLGGINTDGNMNVATGPIWTANRSMAVDPSVIPYGSVVHVYIPGATQYNGIFLAEDTGGAIKGKRIDLGLDQSIVWDFGRRYNCEITILEQGTGPSDARDKASRWSSILSKYGADYVGSGGGVSYGDGTGLGGAIDGYEANDPGSTMFRGKAPEIEDDDYPAHRYAGNPFVLRIGDSQFFIPPTYIKTEKATNVDSRHTVRQKSPMMTKSGHTTQKLTIAMVMDGTDMLNGYPVKGPGGVTYYMDGLRSLLAQLYKNPFLPIRNEFINDRLGIFNVALYDIQYASKPDYGSNTVSVILTFLEATVEPFTGYPDFLYDRLIVYPLFRWFYQQQLLDDESKRFTNTYLKPVPEQTYSDVFFKTLDRELVEQMKEDVVNNNDTKNNGGYTNPEYALSRFHIGDIGRLMTEWPIGAPVVQSVEVRVGKELTPITIEDFEKPAFQDLGGVDKFASIQFYCTDRSEVESLTSMVTHLEEMSRDYRKRFVSGFLAIDNPLINLAGIYYGMVVSIDVETVPDFENNFIVRLLIKSFDPTNKNQERLNGFNYSETEVASHFDDVNDLITKLDQKNGIAYEYAMNKVFNTLEMYPDLELPNYDAVNKAITSINAYRKKRGQSELPFTKLRKPKNAIYVDPDFYFAYPTISQAYEDLELGDMGDKIINVLMNGSYDEVENMSDEPLGLSEAYNQIMNGVQDNAFGEDLQWKRKLEKDQSVKLPQQIQTYLVPAGQAWTKEEKIPSDSKLIEMMTHDMVRHNKRGRMSRAFPTYMLVFIDEGQWVDGRRLFNNYYTYHSIHEISVVKDKDNPVDLAYVRMNNTYGTFDWESKMTDPRTYSLEPRGLKNRVKALFDDFNWSIDEKIIQENSELMDHARLQEGARVHIRLGYSSYPDDLPIVFNGHIASVNEGEEIDMVCQGDGVELINSLYSTDPKGGTPNEPHNTLQEMLTKRTSNYWHSVSADYEFGDNYLSYYGIEHFGFVESTAKSGFWKGLIADHWKIVVSVLNDSVPMHAYDVMKNIYKGSQSPITGQNTGWNPFDGEKNININSYNKTPWDIGQTLSQFVPEFVFAPHVHGFRSTLFFGMPHWPVKHGYVLKDGASGTEFSDYDEMVKPFQQFHVITTGNDIISNTIKASSEHIAHVAVGIYKLGDGQKAAESWTVYADRSILRDTQKMMVVDTGVWQDLFGPDFLYTALGKYVLKPFMELPADIASMMGEIIEFLPLGSAADDFGQTLQDWANDFSGWIDEDAIFTPGQVQARTVAIGALQRKFMEMYQGELVIFGDPAIKPWDIFYLDDSHQIISGTAQVGKVSHSMSRATGFTTVIKPDLLVSRTDGKGSRAAIINGCISLGAQASVIMSRKLLTSRFVHKMASLGGRGTIKAASSGVKLASKAIPRSIKNFKPARVAAWGSKAKSGVSTAFKTAGPKALKLLKSNIFTMVVGGALSEWLNTWYEKENKYNNMIYIYPLWKMGRPFAAGITAAAHIIPGYIDPKFADPHMTQNPPRPVGGSSGEGGSGTIMHPLNQKTRITSGYGLRFNGTDFHDGTDLAPSGYGSNGLAIDTPIRAVADGTIIRSGKGYNGGMGNFVWLKINVNGQDHVICYFHMQDSGYLPGLSTGSKVKAGQALGIMGKTGHVVGNGDPTHLHIEVCVGSTRVYGDGWGGGGSNRTNPEVWFRKQGVTL